VETGVAAGVEVRAEGDWVRSLARYISESIPGPRRARRPRGELKRIKKNEGVSKPTRDAGAKLLQQRWGALDLGESLSVCVAGSRRDGQKFRATTRGVDHAA